MYKNRIMLILLAVSMVTLQAFAFSTAQTTANNTSKELSIKAEINECIKTAESKEAIYSCLETYKVANCVNIAESKEALYSCLETK